MSPADRPPSKSDRKPVPQGVVAKASRPRPAHPSRAVGAGVPSTGPRVAGAPRAASREPGTIKTGVADREPKAASLGGAAQHSSVVSDQSAERFAERAEARRHSARRPYLVSAVVVAVIALLAGITLFSPVLALDKDQIAVEGVAGVVDESAVLAVAEKAVGTPLARIDVEAIEAELAKIHGVRSASVTRAWPGGILVAIEARLPVAAVPGESGVTFVDRDAVQVGQGDEAPDNLPIIEMSLTDKRAHRTLIAALAVLDGMPEDLRGQIAEVSATSPDSVRMTLRDGKTVVWGDELDIALKVAVLESLRKQVSDVSEYDVSAPRAPVTR